MLWPRLIKKYGGQLTDSLDLSSLSKISDGYTPGQIVNVIQNVLSERRIKQVCLELYQYFLDIVRLPNVLCTFSLRPVTRGYPTNIYLLKFNERNTRKRCEICLKVNVNFFKVNFKDISHLPLVILLLTLNKQMLAGYGFGPNEGDYVSNIFMILLARFIEKSGDSLARNVHLKYLLLRLRLILSQHTLICSNSIIEALKKGVKYVLSKQRHQKGVSDVSDLFLMSLLLTLNIFHTFFYFFYC